MTVTLQNQALTVPIEGQGAQLCSVRSPAGDEYIWQADPAVWAATPPSCFL